MPDTIRAERRFTVLEQYLHDLFEECRDAMEESREFIAQSQKARDKSRELVAVAQRLKTH